MTTMGAVKVAMNGWEESPLEPWPPLDKVLTARLWSDPEFEDARVILGKAVISPVISMSESKKYHTIKSDRSVVEAGGGGAADADPPSSATDPGQCGLVHVAQMHVGQALPPAICNLQYCLAVVELPSDFYGGVHGWVKGLVDRGLPVVVCGDTKSVREAVQGFRNDDSSQSLYTYETHLFCHNTRGNYTHDEKTVAIVTNFAPTNHQKIPRYVSTYGETSMPSTLCVEYIGFLVVKLFGIDVDQVPAPWVLVLTDTPNLAGQVTVRLRKELNCTVGFISDPMPQEFPEAVAVALQDADALPYILWPEVLAAISAGEPVDLSGQRYVEQEEEAEPELPQAPKPSPKNTTPRKKKEDKQGETTPPLTKTAKVKAKPAGAAPPPKPAAAPPKPAAAPPKPAAAAPKPAAAAPPSALEVFASRLNPKAKRGVGLPKK